MTNSILVIDSDTSLTQLLIEYLEPEGFQLTCVHDGESGLTNALNQSFDAIILEINLPKLNGFQVIKAIRQHSEIPLLILSARDNDRDRIVGLEVGADDYLTKPYNPRELIARLHVALRRGKQSLGKSPSIDHHQLHLDCSKRILTVAGKYLELTNTEFNILEMLMKSAGKAFSKEELTEYALGRKYTAYDRSIDVHVSNLRSKLGNNANEDPYIKTIRAFGYMFDS